MTTNDGPQTRVIIQWTSAAKKALKKLPKKESRGIFDEVERVCEAGDPRPASKPLTGPLQGYFRVRYGRYRAVFRVAEDRLANGDVIITLTVQVVVVGIRKQDDKNDIYNVAKKIVDMGIIDIDPDV